MCVEFIIRLSHVTGSKEALRKRSYVHYTKAISNLEFHNQALYKLPLANPMQVRPDQYCYPWGAYSPL